MTVFLDGAFSPLLDLTESLISVCEAVIAMPGAEATKLFLKVFSLSLPRQSCPISET